MWFYFVQFLLENCVKKRKTKDYFSAVVNMGDEASGKVDSILENIKKNQGSKSEEEAADHNDTAPVKKRAEVPRGIPKSGRFWKSNKEKFSSINKTKGLKQSFEKKAALRLELKRTKELSKQVQEELKQRELTRKERRRENIKRTEENKRKAEVVQVITNTAKLKRMRKKQLRFIQKRDTNKDVEASK